MAEQRTELTEEQSALIPSFYEKWYKLGLSTEPANRPLAEEACRQVYLDQGVEPPTVFLWADSPKQGAQWAALLARPKNGFKNPTADQIRDMIVVNKDNPEPTQEEMNDVLAWGKLGFGNQDAHWFGYFEFFRTIGVEGLEKADALIKMAENASWWWSFEYAAIIVERPVRLNIDEEGRLHDHSGMAIQYRDGWGLYCHRNIEVSEQVIMRPETLTMEQIFGERNAEIRRCMIERLGYDRFFAMANPKVLDEDTDELGKVRRLLQIELQDDEPVTVIQLTNSTAEPDGHFKNYYIRVHPELRPMFADGTTGDRQELTCQNAVASTHGMYGKEYILVEQS